jgi:hypothetical protein
MRAFSWPATGFAAAGAVVLMAVCSAPRAAPAAGDAPRWALLEDNDGMVSKQDRHYTQGMRITDLLPEPAPGKFVDRSFDAIGTVLPMYRPGGRRRLEWIVFGQSVFTPEDLNLSIPDPHDRPYAAWVYTGAALLQENSGRRLDSLEVLGGIIGPDAFGRGAQDGFHRVFGFGSANGWSRQLQNRGAFQFSYEHHERIGVSLGNRWGIDAVPEAGISAGSVMQYAEAGLMLRAGNALQADYGPEHIRPALSGTAWFDDQALDKLQLGFYLFAAAQGRRVFFNRFIDAAHEVAPLGLEHRNNVTDLLVGGSFFVGRHAHADLSATRRAREFEGQNRSDLFGSAALTLQF